LTINPIVSKLEGAVTAVSAVYLPCLAREYAYGIERK
jgi:hypothetical protein